MNNSIYIDQKSKSNSTLTQEHKDNLLILEDYYKIKINK